MSFAVAISWDRDELPQTNAITKAVGVASMLILRWKGLEAAISICSCVWNWKLIVGKKLGASDFNWGG